MEERGIMDDAGSLGSLEMAGSRAETCIIGETKGIDGKISKILSISNHYVLGVSGGRGKTWRVDPVTVYRQHNTIKLQSQE